MTIQIKSNHYVIKTDHFYAPEPIDGTVYIEVNNSRIEQVSFEPPESGVELVDLTDYVVGPGFVDVHIHGFAGHDTMEGTLEAISSMAEKLASTGTTAFLPTTTGAPVETLKPIMQLSNSFAQVKGAKPLALHLEGPFISKKVPGAMDPNLFRQANRDDIIELLSEGKALMVTMAPEIEGHLDMIELFAGYGVSVSLGHTSTDYETAAKAYAKGATSITHYFNAMSPFQHRQPGLIGAGLLYPFYLQFIADGVHTHIATMKIMCKYVKDRLVLITDATMAAGLGKPGKYTLGNRTIIVDETSARLENGTLAGSVLAMDKGFRNLINIGGLSLSEAFTCASLLPAKSIGLKDRGTIKKGSIADMVILNKETLQVEATIGEEISSMQEQISSDKIIEDIRNRLRDVKKLIVTDLDGTLLNNDSELPQEYVEEIKDMLSPEVKLTIASGRGYPSVKTFAYRFPIDVPVICEAGAVVVDPVTEEIIYQQFIEEDVVKAIIDHLVRRKYRCNLYLYRGNSMICYKRPEVPVFTEKEPAPVVNTDLSDIPPEALVGVRKVSIILDEEYLNQLKEELRELLGDKIDVMRADDGCLDIMASGVTKGSALQHMLQICGIDPEHVMAIGDNESDATMFDVVKFSVAVANADDFTKSKASFVTSSNEDKGVLLAIKHFLEAGNG